MDFKSMSDVDIIELQYSLLEELKQKKTQSTLIITEEITTSESAEDFIRQKFTDKSGVEETPNQQICRIKWFDLDCPSYKELSNYTSLSYKTIRKIASRFEWKSIFADAVKLGWKPQNKTNFVDNSKVERDTKQYNRYREKVLRRDGVCQCCGSKEDLEVHHPMPFNEYNSLGADTNNGITLCKDCHSKYHSEYGYKRNANAVTLALFLRDYGMNPQTQFVTENTLEAVK